MCSPAMLMRSDIGLQVHPHRVFNNAGDVERQLYLAGRASDSQRLDTANSSSCAVYQLRIHRPGHRSRESKSAAIFKPPNHSYAFSCEDRSRRPDTVDTCAIR